MCDKFSGIGVVAKCKQDVWAGIVSKVNEETSLARSKAMENKKLLMGTAMVALSAIALSQQASAITQGVTINATVLTPLAATKAANLTFGSMTVGATTGDTVTINNLGARSQGGGGQVTLIGAGGQAGLVNITQKNGTNVVDYSFNTAVVTLTANAGADTMKVSAFSCNGVANTCSTNATVGAASAAIGGTLTVAAGQNAGTYTGSVTVNINYQ